MTPETDTTVDSQTQPPTPPQADGSAVTESSTDGPAGGDGLAALRAELERVQLEKTQLFERLARAQAEFANSRRRLEQDQEQALQYANQSLLKVLLPLMDNLERAVAVDPAKADGASILQGVQLVRDQFETALKAQRVEVIAPKPGEDFDPSRHEALLQQPSDHPEGSVAMLLNKGYSLLGRTLRPAQVAVARAK